MESALNHPVVWSALVVGVFAIVQRLMDRDTKRADVAKTISEGASVSLGILERRQEANEAEAERLRTSMLQLSDKLSDTREELNHTKAEIHRLELENRALKAQIKALGHEPITSIVDQISPPTG